MGEGGNTSVIEWLGIFKICIQFGKNNGRLKKGDNTDREKQEHDVKVGS